MKIKNICFSRSLFGNQLVVINLYHSLLYLDYSFKNSSIDLMKNIRNLISQNSFDEILIQLFEYMCIIHGYVCSTIDLLKEKIQQSNAFIPSMNQSEITLYS